MKNIEIPIASISAKYTYVPAARKLATSSSNALPVNPTISPVKPKARIVDDASRPVCRSRGET